MCAISYSVYYGIMLGLAFGALRLFTSASNGGIIRGIVVVVVVVVAMYMYVYTYIYIYIYIYRYVYVCMYMFMLVVSIVVILVISITVVNDGMRVSCSMVSLADIIDSRPMISLQLLCLLLLLALL